MMTYASSSIPFPSISIHRTPSLKLSPREHRKKKLVLFENHFLTINLGKEKDSRKRFSLFLSPRNFNENPRETIEPTDWKTYSLWISFARFSFLFKKWVSNTANCYYLGSFWKFKWINADFNKIIVTCHENLFSYMSFNTTLYPITYQKREGYSQNPNHNLVAIWHKKIFFEFKGRYVKIWIYNIQFISNGYLPSNINSY